MSFYVAGTFVAVTAASAYMSYQQGQKANQLQQDAMNQAQANAKASASMQEQQINAANAKAPNTSALQSANEQSAKGGQSGTMLTGPGGVDLSNLTLSKNTLLGG